MNKIRYSKFYLVLFCVVCLSCTLLKFNKVSEYGSQATATRQVASVNSQADDSNFVSVCDRTAEIKDEVLTILGKNSCDQVAKSDIESIKKLNLTGTGLSGFLENDFFNFTVLETLFIGSTRGENQITDISALGAFNTLKWLYAQSNNISDISVLKNHPFLTVLYISGNNISDISVLQHLVHIEGLGLSENPLITDISPLKALASRLIELHLRELKNIKDFTPLKYLTRLKYLYLNHTNISDISVLIPLAQLEVLDLSDTPIEDFTLLKHLTRLTRLYLDNTNIRDVSMLASLPLDTLSLYGTAITDAANLRILASIPTLQDLYLPYLDKIQDKSVLEEFGNNTTLHFESDEKWLPAPPPPF